MLFTYTVYIQIVITLFNNIILFYIHWMNWNQKKFFDRNTNIFECLFINKKKLRYNIIYLNDMLLKLWLSVVMIEP